MYLTDASEMQNVELKRGLVRGPGRQAAVLARRLKGATRAQLGVA